MMLNIHMCLLMKISGQVPELYNYQKCWLQDYLQASDRHVDGGEGERQGIYMRVCICELKGQYGEI